MTARQAIKKAGKVCVCIRNTECWVFITKKEALFVVEESEGDSTGFILEWAFYNVHKERPDLELRTFAH